MSLDEQTIDLSQIAADGWYDQLVDSSPALARLATALGDGLLALSLVAGFRIESAVTERTTEALQELRWHKSQELSPTLASLTEELRVSRDQDPATTPAQVNFRGPIATLRTEVLASLVGEAESAVSAEDVSRSPETLRAFIGARSALLAPLFGLGLRTLRLSAEGDARVVVAHDNIEEVVPLKQLRRFLRQRVVEVLQQSAGRSQVAIELAQADLAQIALDEGRPQEVVARLISWIAPLSVYHRSPEGQALDPSVRARLARALGALAQAYGQLGRLDEQHETLRLSLQYALDGEAAGPLFLALGHTFLSQARFGEAIGPFRRARTLKVDEALVLPPLARALHGAGRSVAALACVRSLSTRTAEDDALLQTLHDALGEPASALDAHMARQH
ncbi:MAG: hypothetical protein Q8Q09_27500 [Deltaproteobacteria bacterium]|nr:hypothetical protein [Deltaproteobacteria bacterium]